MIDDGRWQQAHRWLAHALLGSRRRALTALASALALSGSAAPWLSVFSLSVVLALATLIFLTAFVGRLIYPAHDDTDESAA